VAPKVPRLKRHGPKTALDWTLQRTAVAPMVSLLQVETKIPTTIEAELAKRARKATTVAGESFLSLMLWN